MGSKRRLIDPRCEASRCARVTLDLLGCAVFTDTEDAWANGKCWAHTTDPDWEGKAEAATEVYKNRRGE